MQLDQFVVVVAKRLCNWRVVDHFIDGKVKVTGMSAWDWWCSLTGTTVQFKLQQFYLQLYVQNCFI